MGLVGYTLVTRGGLLWPAITFEVRFYEVALALVILGAALVAITSRSRLGAIAALGAAGYCVALIFLLFGAPDLAMTQILVETLTVVLFVFVFYRLPTQTSTSSTLARLRDAGIALSIGALVASNVLTAMQTTQSRDVSNYYVNHSVLDAHGRNIVNVILVDFRALDTLGEITVVALAAVGVFSLLKLRSLEEDL